MKVLVTGGTGQVGHALLHTAPPGIDIVAPTRSDFDLGAPDTLPDTLARLDPDAIINPAAYTAVDKAESETEQARRINADSAGVLAQYCSQNGMPFIHVSTDFVFDGGSDSPYRPSDPTAPLGVYGATKRAGEEQVQRAHDDAWIVRASWVYSEHGNNFVKTMLRLANEGRALSVVADQTGTPTYARNLAKTLWQVLTVKPEPRLLHYSDGGQTTWHGFAEAVFSEAVQLGLLPGMPELSPTTTANYPTPARRPAYSVLDCSETTAVLGITLPGWRSALRDMLARLKTAEG